MKSLLDTLSTGNDHGIPTLSAAIASIDRVLWSGSTADNGLLFGIGSITKTVVAVIVMQLVEEGQLRLDRTPAQLLDDKTVAGIANAETATLERLLNHSSGIPNWEDDPVWIRDARGNGIDAKRYWSQSETLDYIRAQPPLFSPGEKTYYANTNYTLLGLIAEEVTGDSLVTLLRRRILAPLGVEDIYLEGFQALPKERIPKRYHYATEKFRRQAGVAETFKSIDENITDVSSTNLSVEWAAGGLITSVEALAQFGAALRNGRLLKPASLAAMQHWAEALNMQVGAGLFRRQWRGCSCLDDSSPAGSGLIGHSGNVLGFSGFMYWFEEYDLTVAILANIGSMHSEVREGGIPWLWDATQFALNSTFLQQVKTYYG